MISEAMQAMGADIRKALDAFTKKIADNAAEINDYMAALRTWKPGTYAIGDVRVYDGNPYKCTQAHDSTSNPAWTPDTTPALWMQYHGTTIDTARAWIAPTGAHDMYRPGEYMIYTDGHTYRCMSETIYSPVDYAAAWEIVS